MNEIALANNAKKKWRKCLKLLNSAELSLSENEVLEIEEYLNGISQMCFAGSYVVMPQYIVDVSLELDASSIGSLQYGGLGGLVFASCDFESTSALTLASKQYREYLDSCFEFVECDILNYETGAAEYIYDYFILTEISLESLQMLQIWMNVGLFDLDKIDTSDLELTIADVIV